MCIFSVVVFCVPKSRAHSKTPWVHIPCGPVLGALGYMDIMFVVLFCFVL